MDTITDRELSSVVCFHYVCTEFIAPGLIFPVARFNRCKHTPNQSEKHRRRVLSNIINTDNTYTHVRINKYHYPLDNACTSAVSSRRPLSLVSSNDFICQYTKRRNPYTCARSNARALALFTFRLPTDFWMRTRRPLLIDTRVIQNTVSWCTQMNKYHAR